MTLSVSIVVATYGDWYWHRLAQSRAVPSAEAFGVPVVQYHADYPAGLHDARNGALGHVSTEWIIYLDADDELEPGYLDAMAAGTADVRAPSVRYVRLSGIAAPPIMPRVAGHRHTCVAECLPYGNWLVIGSMVRADLIRTVGGWLDFPAYEDWSTWLRCYQAGATFEPIPAAVYRAHVRRDSRNRGQSNAAKLAAHRAIARAHGVPVP